MSEQRFYITDTGLGLDTVSDEMYGFGDEEDFCRLFDKLNEQQATIQSLKEENEKLKKRNKFLEEFDGRAKTVANLKEENEQLKKELLRIQKTVSSIQKEINNYYNEVCSNE